jgi:energy-coupling factor transporter transmembrane protein EcfT
MSIALRFLADILEETEKIKKAQSSRGADYDTVDSSVRQKVWFLF